MTATIEFRDVSKVYPDGTRATDHLRLLIEPGSFTVFVGPSGCGKTTAMRMINRMVTPTSGIVAVDGRNVAALDAVRLRRGIGYVMQSAGLLPHRTVIDNVATVPVLCGQSRRAARHAALELLARVGLDPVLGARYPAQLSGGQQQRVGVARALAADPPILLMDEPFSAVDPVVRAGLQTEMLRLQAELRKTIVFVTHDLDEALTLGERIAVFGHRGRLEQLDTPQRVLSAPANEFVSSFVGTDRGYRALSFRDADGLVLRRVWTATADALPSLSLDRGEWVLLVTDDGAPRGWIDVVAAAALNSGTELAEAMSTTGSVFTVGSDLRRALDAAVSSPSGIGVAVDAAGVVVGGIDPADILSTLNRQRHAEDRVRTDGFFARQQADRDS